MVATAIPESKAAVPEDNTDRVPAVQAVTPGREFKRKHWHIKFSLGYSFHPGPYPFRKLLSKTGFKPYSLDEKTGHFRFLNMHPLNFRSCEHGIVWNLARVFL